MRRTSKRGGKSIWLFVGSNYDEAGGMGDFVGRFDSVADAVTEVGDIQEYTTTHPGCWLDDRQVMATSMTFLVAGSIDMGADEPPAMPSWASEPPPDAPERPSDRHFWRPEQHSTSHKGPDWAHVVDARTAEVLVHLCAQTERGRTWHRGRPCWWA